MQPRVIFNSAVSLRVQARRVGTFLSNQIGPNGRPIAFVYSGDIDRADGDEDVFLDSELMIQSINIRQLELGHAYPLFYDTLFDDLRRTMVDSAKRARESGDNVWSADATNEGAEYSGAESIATMPPNFPKLCGADWTNTVETVT